MKFLFYLSFISFVKVRSESQFAMDDGLELTLSASEPEILSLSNIDVDHEGRVWACEVINYGPNKGKRKEGDRILIMEDKDGDGKMDEFKTFYQGNEVNAAMGLCVLSDRVIVSVTPNVWVFYDDNGDDKADRKELLFTGDGAECHDHSYHSLVFGLTETCIGTLAILVEILERNKVTFSGTCMIEILRIKVSLFGEEWYLDRIWMVITLKFLLTILEIIMK